MEVSNSFAKYLLKLKDNNWVEDFEEGNLNYS